MIRIAITGGLGFIGEAWARVITGEAELLIVDNLHRQVHRDRSATEGLPSRATFLEGDIADPSTAALVADFLPDIVVHLAAETGTGQSLRESRRHADVNVTGTATVLDALSRAGSIPKLVVLTSSRAVYGEGKWKDEQGSAFYAQPRSPKHLKVGRWTPIGANGEIGSKPLAHSARSTEPRPSSVYAATKLCQEHLLAAWCTSFDVPLRVLRLQNVYGRGQSLSNPYTGVLTLMAKQASLRQRIHVYEHGGIIRDFVHVNDVASALTAAIDRATASGLQLLDVGSGEPCTLFEVAQTLARLAGAPPPIATDEFRHGDVRAAFADNDEARRALSFVPRVTLEEGLKELVEWAQGATAE